MSIKLGIRNKFDGENLNLRNTSHIKKRVGNGILANGKQCQCLWEIIFVGVGVPYSAYCVYVHSLKQKFACATHRHFISFPKIMRKEFAQAFTL